MRAAVASTLLLFVVCLAGLWVALAQPRAPVPSIAHVTASALAPIAAAPILVSQAAPPVKTLAATPAQMLPAASLAAASGGALVSEQSKCLGCCAGR